MSKSLPAPANLEQLKKQAKTLLKGQQAGDPKVLRLIKEQHPKWHDADEKAIQMSQLTLADAQLVVAREYGFTSWAKLKAKVASDDGGVTAAIIQAFRNAAGQGDLQQINALLDAHPEIINEAAGEGVRTALHQAVFGNQEMAVKLLLERGADPNIRCEGDNAYPLHFAVEKARFPIIQILVEHGADTIGEGDYHDLGVLGWTTAWDYITPDPKIVNYLLAHGAQHNIFSAVAVGDVEAIKRLVAESPANLERRMDLTNRRRRPLHLAVVKKQPAALKALLDLGANMESLDEAFFTALDQAGLTGETDLAEILLERGAKVRLPAAVGLQRTADIERLLRRDPDCLKPGARWGNLILRASERSPGNVIESLIRGGASVNVRDNPKTAVDTTAGYTPLHAAAFSGNLSAAEVLLRYGASVQAREEKWRGTPAGWANYAGHAEVRDLILRGPVDIMEAVEYGLTERVSAILHADPAALERRLEEYPIYPIYVEGWFTPLALAISRGQREVVELLIQSGADATVKSPEGERLQAMAMKKGY